VLCLLLAGLVAAVRCLVHLDIQKLLLGLGLRLLWAQAGGVLTMRGLRPVLVILAAAASGCTYYTAATTAPDGKLYVFGGRSLLGLGWSEFVLRCEPGEDNLGCRKLAVDEDGRVRRYRPPATK
jgi:hypothetical protein